MNTISPVISTTNLQKIFDGEHYVLQDISLSIMPGSIIGYIGPNGAGKTTTVKILAGMLGDFEGMVRVLGYDIKTEALEVKKRIGFVPEETALYATLTPLEFLTFIAGLYELCESETTPRIHKLLSLFGLGDQINCRMNTFSKGMKQKVLLIAGMLHNPDIIFLDEPLSGLDAGMIILIKEILSGLAASGKTIFYCSHIMDVVERISHRIILINNGHIVTDGSFDELQQASKEESLERIFSSLTGNESYPERANEFIDVILG